MNDRSGDGTGNFKVEVRRNTAKFTNIITARFSERRYLARDIKVLIKDETRIANNMTRNQ